MGSVPASLAAPSLSNPCLLERPSLGAWICSLGLQVSELQIPAICGHLLNLRPCISSCRPGTATGLVHGHLKKSQTRHRMPASASPTSGQDSSITPMVRVTSEPFKQRSAYISSRAKHRLLLALPATGPLSHLLNSAIAVPEQSQAACKSGSVTVLQENLKNGR